MLEKILQEILEMEYPKEEIINGLNDNDIRYSSLSAAYGFGVAQEKIMELIRGHIEDEKTAELYRQSADFKRYVDKYCNDYGYTTQEALEHALVREVAKEYQPVKKTVGDDYKQQIMSRFLKME
ncbi:MAG: hypothetical protein HFH87_00605 [Lachnospiraceae bacterium]|nr:hypothetical protein [Lachnospiraceae bacterium]